ncbi:MAG: ribonuclease R [Acidobacteriota bacterium]
MSPSEEHRLHSRVQRLFDRHPNKGFRSREVRKKLNIADEDEFQSLRTVLHEMADSGELLYTKQRGYHRPGFESHDVTGTLTVTRSGMGFVEVEGMGEVYIAKRSLSTALNGDTVRVAIFGGRKSKKNRDEHVEGEVIEVVERAQKEFVGRLEHSKNFYFVVCDDPTVTRDIYIPAQFLAGARAGEKVVASLERWDSEHLNPEGRILSIIGQSGSIHTEIQSVIETFHLSKKFPQAVEEAAHALPGRIPAKEIAARRDLRELATMTIDPVDAKDFDDALSIEVIDHETIRLGVHIADVGAYVKEGSALDKEAFERGTSVYLANQVVPMLPERISNNLCSLVPDKDRLAYTCFMDVTSKGKVKSYEIVHSVICSKRRFTYEEVEAILDAEEGEFSEELSRLWSLASMLRAKRLKCGAVDFDSPEAKFRYDEKGKPVEIITKERLKSHQLVEECMLLANRTVAEHIGKVRKEEAERPFVYRVHDLPDREKLKELSLFVKKFGYTLNVSGSVSSKELQRLLEQARGTKEENVINEVAIRSMAKAVYSEKNIGHFGLAFDHYTHFTSPIRRYPDLMVHRLLDEYARGMSVSRMHEHASKLGFQCKWASDRERVAMEAERMSVKVMQVEYMRDRIGEEYEAVISGVASYGLFVEINTVLVEGLLHVRNLGDDYYRFDERAYTLVGERHGRQFRLGDEIRVTVAAVDVERRMIDFALAPEPKASRHHKRSHDGEEERPRTAFGEEWGLRESSHRAGVRKPHEQARGGRGQGASGKKERRGKATGSRTHRKGRRRR